MFIYVAKTFTATASGKQLVPITCAKCHTQYAYELARLGAGTGSAPYYIGQQSAQNRAQRAAEKALARRLEREAELVPCPKCNWIDEEQISRYRRMHYGWVLVTGCILAALAAVIGFTIATNLPTDQERIIGSVVVALAVAGPLALSLMLQGFLRARINPNLTYPRRPTLPLGTPPALLPSVDSQTGQTIYTPVPTEDDPAEEWAIFRPGELVLPEICCECLAPAETVFSTPFKINENSELAVPLCRKCFSTLRWRWWALFGKSMGAAGLIASLTFLIPGMDSVGQWFLAILLFCILWGIGLVTICQWRVRPYQLKTSDTLRNIYSIRFRNPEYTNRLRALLAPKAVVVESDVAP